MSNRRHFLDIYYTPEKSEFCHLFYPRVRIPIFRYSHTIMDIPRCQKVELSFNCRPACYVNESDQVALDADSMFIEFQFELRDRTGDCLGIIPDLTEVHKITVVSSK